jgi:mRNA interferase MazF
MNRGDVVIVRFPFADGRGGKNRPAVIIQNDHDNARTSNTIIAMITGNTRLAHLPTQVLLDPADPDGQSSGVFGRSAVKATTLYTIEQRDILRQIGRLSDATLRKLDQALRMALDLT